MLRRIAPGLACLVVAAAFGSAPRVARAGDAIPPEGLRLPLTGKQTVRNDGKNYYLDGACVIPPGAEIRIEQNVRVYGLNGASLDVQGGLSVHGTKDSWVYFVNVDFSPTTSPDKMMHLDMASMHGCKLVHAQDAAFEGGITIENCCWQYDCKFDVKVASGKLPADHDDRVHVPVQDRGDADEGEGRRVRDPDVLDEGHDVQGRRVGHDPPLRGARAARAERRDGLRRHTGPTSSRGRRCGRRRRRSLLEGPADEVQPVGRERTGPQRPAGADVKAERVQVERFFFENENGGAVLGEKDAGDRVKDGVDDPTQAVKAIVVTPNKRRHVFLSSSLRQRAPPVGGAR